jgi:hypothetical protein
LIKDYDLGIKYHPG